MHDGPLADLFRSTEASQEAAARADELLDDDARPALRAVDEFDQPAVEPAFAPTPALPLQSLSPGAEANAYLAVIRVVGVGGGGVNAVNRMVESGVRGVEFIAVNTDAQQLALSEAQVRIHIGRRLTEGLGSGSDADVGRRAAEEADEDLRRALRGSDLVFVTAGEGGGTGSGAAPVVARIARELGALTVGIVTTPFGFEGARRMRQADEGVTRLRHNVDTLVVIPNERLMTVLDKRTSIVDAFGMADDVLRQGVQGICDLITTPGIINLDFADVRTIMRDAGSAMMGVGMASGPSRARDAARRAISSPLFDQEIRGATGIILSVAGGPSLSLHDAMEVAEIVREAADPGANIIFGTSVDESLRDQLWVTVIASGFGDQRQTIGRVENTSPIAPPTPPDDDFPSFEFARPPRPSDDLEVPDFLR